ncbi:MAG: putative ABC transporter permease [Acetobacter sp.]|nr:putative ABC transporter permease [Acetobacter sp.]
MKKFGENLILFLFMGLAYFGIEILWRGHSHWTMIVVGGLCGLSIGILNENMSWDLSLLRQALYGAGLVTLIEFAAGCILNLKLGLGIWDYSNLPLNIMGQICLPFTIAWFGLSLIAIFLDDYLRWKWFGEEKPHYHWI